MIAYDVCVMCLCSSESLEGTVSMPAVTPGPRVGITNRSIDELAVITTEALTC